MVQLKIPLFRLYECVVLWALPSVHVSSESKAFGNPCYHQFDVDTQNTSFTAEADKTTKVIRFSVDYKVDPCENFYNFACGNWIINTPGTPLPWGRITIFDLLEETFQKEMREGLRTVKHSKSKAITQASTLYNLCVDAEGNWKSEGISGVRHLMDKIKEYGIFPMFSEKELNETDFEEDFDLTSLLAYFNTNKTVLSLIVPTVIYRERMPTAVISFGPRNSIFSFLLRGITSDLRNKFTVFMFHLVKAIAADSGLDYDSTTAPKDIVEMTDFMKELHDIPVPDVEKIRSDNGFINWTKFEFLHEVEENTEMVNWTEYLLLVSPPEVHGFLSADPKVFADLEYIKRVDEVLRGATPRTLTNFVMVQYILSWLSLLEEKYRAMVETFAASVGTEMPKSRSELCYRAVEHHFHQATVAIYVRSKKDRKVKRKIMKEMLAEIIDSIKNEIENNTWMDEEFKDFVVAKVTNIDSRLLYDDDALNDKALDEMYREHTKLGNLPFLELLDGVSRIKQRNLFLKLLHDGVSASSISLSATKVHTNAFYSPMYNTIVVPLPLVQYPIFDRSFKTAFNYGSMAFVLAHELSHALDGKGLSYDEKGHRQRIKKEWLREFRIRLDCYLDLYDKIKIPIFGEHLDSSIMEREIVADHAGMKFVYKAFKIYQKKHGAQRRSISIEDFTDEQVFFLGFATTFCTKISDLTLYHGLDYDHAESLYRVNNIVSNMPEFAEAFFCSPKSKMTSKEHCSIW